MAVHSWRSEGCYINKDESGHELNPHGTSDFPVACYRENLGATEVDAVPEHWHSDLELVCVTEGAAKLICGGTSVPLPCGSAAFINMDSRHTLLGAPQASICSAVFNMRLVCGMPDSVFAHRYVSPVLASGHSYVVFGEDEKSDLAGAPVSELIQQAIDAAYDEREGFELDVRQALSRCMLVVWERLGKPKMQRSGRMGEADRLQTMCMFVKEHLGERFTVADIAASANISERECLRAFRKGFDMSPVRYVTLSRLSVAAGQLLSDQRASVGSIAARVGIPNSGYFARLFRAEYGCTPREYRDTMGKSLVSRR